jgi:hypothetical protein
VPAAWARRTRCARICGSSRRAHLRKFAGAGVDQVAFIQQGGRNRHEHICEALDLFGREIMGEFKEREAERQKKKNDELAPFIEKAFARKQRMKELADDEIPNVVALGRQIAQQQQAVDPKAEESARRFAQAGAVPLADPLAKPAAE